MEYFLMKPPLWCLCYIKHEKYSVKEFSFCLLQWPYTCNISYNIPIVYQDHTLIALFCTSNTKYVAYAMQSLLRRKNSLNQRLFL